jgi:hypothetical protein
MTRNRPPGYKSKGAPGLAFETWDPRNRSRMESPPPCVILPVSSQGWHERFRTEVFMGLLPTQGDENRRESPAVLHQQSNFKGSATLPLVIPEEPTCWGKLTEE